jgi:hypothetical protein
VIDHRRATLPSSYFVEGTVPFPPGNPVGNELLEVVRERLSRRDMLNPAGVKMHQAELENRFSASARDATFSRMASEHGYPMIRLAVPGHAAQVVDVTVRAAVSDVRLMVGPMAGVEIGEVNRSQHTTSIAVSLGRLLPASGSGSVSDSPSDTSGNLSKGEQVFDRVTDSSGVRRERSRFEQGRVVTARVRVDYDVTLERQTLLRGGGERPGRKVQLPRAATGEAYLTMFEHEYNAMVEQMERGDSVATAWSFATGAKPAGYTTVRPWVIADPAAPSQVLTDALTRAREQQVEVLLTVTEPDGNARYYQALPDGTLHGDTGDGGFAEAFSTLHPRLTQLADEHGLGLRALYDSADSTSPFTAAVVAALASRGVTTDIHPPAFPVTPSSGYDEGSASVHGTTGTAMGGTFAGGSP